MTMLLLVIIYLAFISLGLPDAVLGSAWPMMYQDLNSPIEYAGVIAFVISAGTVLSSLMTVHLLRFLEIGKLVAISVLLTALALLGFAMANLPLALLLLAIPLGVGAGAVDSALNHFVASHYSARHMNYLHSFWGVGATAGPLVMAHFLRVKEGWRDGYMTISLVQCALVMALFVAMPWWRTTQARHAATKESSAPLKSNRQVLTLAGVKTQLLMFFCYCSLEAGTGLWAASFLIIEKHTLISTAAFWVAIYYGGISAGRFMCGAMAGRRFAEETLIRSGVLLITLGTTLLLMPMTGSASRFGLLLIGLGCAPLYPNTIHLTPARFGKSASAAVIGLSMACAYTGTTLIPPALGFILENLSFSLFPWLLLTLAIGLCVTTEQLRIIDKTP